MAVDAVNALSCTINSKTAIVHCNSRNNLCVYIYTILDLSPISTMSTSFQDRGNLRKRPLPSSNDSFSPSNKKVQKPVVS